MQPQLPDISFATFASVDLRVGRILAVIPFPEAHRPAWKLSVDLGPLGMAQTSAQITRYGEDQLVDRLVIAAVNLGNKQIAGFLSECLVLAAVGADGEPRLLSPDAGSVPGDRIA